MADLQYRNGFSVLFISNVMHKEFMQNAATVTVPGYAPRDVSDVVSAVGAAVAELEAVYPDRIGKKALVGISLGTRTGASAH